MYNMNNHLTAQQQQQQQQHPQQQRPPPDIYEILSSDDPTPNNINEHNIDTDALVMGIFDTNYSTIQPPQSNYEEHPLSVHSTTNSIESNTNSFTTTNTNNNNANNPSSTTTTHNEFNFNHDLINFDLNSNNNNSLNTPSSEVMLDPFFTPNYPHEDPIFSSTPNFTFPSTSARRHSVAVTGGFHDLNPRFHHHPTTPTIQHPSQQQHQQQHQQQQHQHQYQMQQQQRQRMLPQQQPSFAHKKLATLVESEPQPNMMHRSSMPNIFLSEESRRQLNANIQQRTMSARTTPNNTPPPPVSINFNQMPWSTSNQQQQDWSPQQQPETMMEPPPMVGRKRFYSQQFDSFPIQSNNTNTTPFRPLQQSNNLCPLPMSGILSRRTSIATPNDIFTWNRKVNPDDRINLERKRRASVFEESTPKTNQFIHSHIKKRIKQEEVAAEDQSELIKEEQDTNSEDYPSITEADLEAAKKDPNAIPRRQKLRYDSDEYTPKWVRYTGQLKEGYCDTCKPGKWLQLKNSAFWYHKQFFHGISSVSGKPFQKPLEQRPGEHDVIEGLCHQCKQFVPICNSKRKNSVLWYRHAHKCHIYDKPKVKGGKRASISVTPVPSAATTHTNNNTPSSTTTATFDQAQKIY